MIIIVCILSVLIIIQIVHAFVRPSDHQRIAYLLLLSFLTTHQVLIMLNAKSAWLNSFTFINSILFFVFFVKSAKISLKALPSKITTFLSALPFPLLAILLACKIEQQNFIPIYYCLISIYIAGKEVLKSKRFDEVSVTLCALIIWSVAPILSPILTVKLFIGSTIVLMGLTNLVLSTIKQRQEYANLQITIERLSSSENKNETPDDLEELTDREIEVAQKLAAGLNAKDIAVQLDLSYNTAKKHLANMYKKYNVSSKKQFLEKLQARKVKQES